jgi:ABC-type glycerol-3-phosphate transport system substrate-binding protein
MSPQFRRISRRQFLHGSALASAGAFLVACAPAAAPGAAPGGAGAAAPAAATNWLQADDISGMPATTMRYWYYESPARVELGKQQVEAFQKLFPNITVEGRTAPEAVDNEMLVAFIKAGTNSHVHQSVCNEDTWYITRDLLLPLQDLPGYQEVSDRMNPNLNYVWGDGNAYAISWYSGPWVMFYNKKLVEEAGLDSANPPKTYSEFLTWAEALTKEGQYFFAPSVGEEWWRWQFVVYPFYIAATGSNQLHSEDGKSAVFNKPETVQVYELFDTLFRKGFNMVEAVEGNPFFSGQVAAVCSAAYNITNAAQFAPEGFEMIVGPIPKPDDSTVEGFPTYNFVREFALMREQHETGEIADRINRAAWEFMKFLLTPEQLAADFAVSGDLPPTQDLLENPLYTDTLKKMGPVAEQYATFAADSVIYDMNTEYESESMAELTKSFLEVAFDRKDAAEAVQWAEEQVNAILAQG